MKNAGRDPSAAPAKPGRTNLSVRPEPVEGLTSSSPLATLNAHIAQAAKAASEGLQAAGSGMDLGGCSGGWPALRSAQRFRETWERLAAEVQVQQAQARAPQNAGPLNPQRLMLDTLARMGDLSPHYLRRFLAHAETLLWLEQLQGQAPGPLKASRPRATEPLKKRKPDRPAP